MNECKRSLRTNFQVYFDLPRSVSKRRRWQRLMNRKHRGAAKISKSMTAPLRHRRVSDLDPISVGTVIFAFTQCATIAASWIADNSLSLLFRYHSVCNDCRKLDCRFCGCSFNIKTKAGNPPHYPACEEKQCKRRSAVKPRKCTNASCIYHRIEINPWILNDKGETTFKPTAGSHFSAQCRKCQSGCLT